MTIFPTSPKPRSSGQFAWLRRLLALAAFGALAFSLLSAPGLIKVDAGSQHRPEQVQGTSVVISEFRTRGSAAGNDEFVELFNPTQNPVDITDWKIVRSTSTGTSPSTRHIFDSVILQPGQYYLVGSLTYSTDPTNTIAQDVVANGGVSGDTEDIGLADGGGLALRRADDSDVDQVGIGATAFGEGTRLLTELTTNVDRGYARVDVCEDNNNNSTDFVLTDPSQPQNSSLPATPCPAPTATPEWQHRLFISEVAWGGTRADDTLAQWIELYNPGDYIDLELNKCFLRIPGKADIELEGAIPAGSYYLIERNQVDTNVETYTYPISGFPTPTETPTNIPGFSVPGMTIAFPLLNVGGDRLELYCGGAVVGEGTLADTANGDGGSWPAGNRFFSYASMERIGPPYGLENDASWLNFFGTPYAADRLGNLINGSPGGPRSLGATSTPTTTPTSTATPTATLSPTLTTTPSALRSVVINEVAWMGTIANGDHEWIELYNPGSVDISLSGWTILIDNTVFITIPSGKVIKANKYFLLMRYEDAIKFPDPASLGEESLFVYPSSKALSNDGKVMKLRAPSQSIDIDTANSNGGGWPAGNNTTKCTMERRGATTTDIDTSWITNTGLRRVAKDAADNDICGTPNDRNWAYDVTPTPSPVGPTKTATRTRTPTPIPPAKISQIILNEFLVHPRSDWNNDGIVDSGDEFIELLNVGNVSVSLQGWRLDDQQGDSSPYTIEGLSLAPGARAVFFASQTGLLLSNRSDSVRLFQTNGAISDAFTYTAPTRPDQTWCRLPDGGPTWVFGCEPTLQQTNKLAETIFRGERNLPAICESPSLPAAVFLTECLPSGLEAWSRRLWDGLLPATKIFFERHGQEYWIE